MRKGTTPTLTFELPPDVPVAEIANAKVTLCQGDVRLEKKLCDCQTSENTLSVKLTQEETLLFACRSRLRFQLRVLTVGGDALATDVMEMFVHELLDEEVLE